MESFSIALDRLPPQNIEVEEAILGGILLDPGAIVRVVDRLKPEAFYIGAHRDIYKAAVALYKQGSPTDLLFMAAYLSDHDLLSRIGGRNKLSMLVDRTVSAVNIDALAEIIIEKHLRRELLRRLNESIDMAYDQITPTHEVLDAVQQKIFDVAQAKTDDRPELIHVTDAFISLISKMEAKREGVCTPVKTGFYDLDALTGGFEDGQLIVLGGRPAMGKSAFAQAIAWDVANIQQRPVLFFSLEMKKEQLAQRLAARLSKIHLNSLKSGNLSEAQWESFYQVAEEIESSHLYFCDKFDININDVKSSMRRAIARTRRNPGLIVVDHLGLLAGVEEGSNDEYQKITKASRDLKNLAGEFNCPVLALSQLSRGVESRQSKRPLMSDLRQSGSIEQDADFVMLMYRDEYYNPESVEKGIAEVILAKGRDSETGTVKLLFDGQFMDFKNLKKF